jgi:hypothetical protein
MVPLPNKKTLQSKNRSWYFEVFLGETIIFIRTTKMCYKDARLWLWIIYKKGKHNIVAYAFSRKEEEIEGSLWYLYSTFW